MRATNGKAFEGWGAGLPSTAKAGEASERKGTNASEILRIIAVLLRLEPRAPQLSAWFIPLGSPSQKCEGGAKHFTRKPRSPHPDALPVGKGIEWLGE